MAKENVIKMPPASVLKSLISKSSDINSKIGDLKGDLGERIAKAVDDHNLHSAAFKLARKLQKMDAVKLMAFLTHFDDYRTKLELDKLAGDSLDLSGDDDSKGDDADDGLETEDEMIKRIAAEKAAEQTAREQLEGADVLDRSKAN
jgi:hypothetical protein